METSVLNQIPIDPGYVILGLAVAVVILFVLLLIVMVRLGRLSRKYNYFMRGKDVESLEDIILDQIEDIKNLKAEDRAVKDAIRTLNRNFRASYQKLGLVKYNAFKGMGGNMSFAMAMLDFTNSGIVMNCVHNRDGCYLYVKEVDAGKTEVVLGNEEQEALEMALGYVKGK